MSVKFYGRYWPQAQLDNVRAYDVIGDGKCFWRAFGLTGSEVGWETARSKAGDELRRNRQRYMQEYKWPNEKLNTAEVRCREGGDWGHITDAVFLANAYGVAVAIHTQTDDNDLNVAPYTDRVSSTEIPHFHGFTVSELKWVHIAWSCPRKSDHFWSLTPVDKQQPISVIPNHWQNGPRGFDLIVFSMYMYRMVRPVKTLKVLDELSERIVNGPPSSPPTGVQLKSEQAKTLTQFDKNTLLRKSR
jgi:hypothetical protein